MPSVTIINLLTFSILKFHIVSCIVVELTPGKFRQTVQNSHGTWIVEFYKPNCPFCEDFMPEYERAAMQLEGSGIHLGRMDAVKYEDFSDRYNVRTYPTIKIFRPGSGVPEDYIGRRLSGDLVTAARNINRNWIKRDDLSLVKKRKNLHGG